MSEPSTTEYEAVRRQHMDALRALGVDPFGGTKGVPNVTPLAAAKALYKPEMGHDGGPRVTVAGRIVLKRDIGKLSFYTLRDDTGDLQVGLQKNKLSEAEWAVLKLLDSADIIVVRGNLGVTNKGEITVWAAAGDDDPGLQIASKALLQPPEKYHGLSDVELRYRQRYVDLFANPDVMRTMQLRIRIVDEIRQFMRAKGFMEVETPMMQVLHGGANARPFVTHHNALDMKLYLRIAPELYLKRLLVGGFSKVFEINRNFRNEGISPRHNPEFTMLECYEAFGSWETMANLIEEMICTIAQNVLGTLKIEHKNAAGEVTRTINLQRPWRRAKMTELVEERTGWKFDGRGMEAAGVRIDDKFQAGAVTRIKVLSEREILGFNKSDSMSNAEWDQVIQRKAGDLAQDVFARCHKLSPHEQLVEVYEKLIEPTLIDPCFVTHVPSVIIPLAKESKDHPGFAEVYELAINGVEISPGYSELNDPDVQKAHFEHQVGDEAEKQQIDYDFLNALKHGMPPAGGLGMGVDRLVMMLTGAESIRDVILFPLMRPQ
jgi:lysyl-tRNA synthetase class 2